MYTLGKLSGCPKTLENEQPPNNESGEKGALKRHLMGEKRMGGHEMSEREADILINNF